MTTAPTLDVVVVNHNSGDLLHQCLKHMGCLPTWQITVVDNASSDGSTQFLNQTTCHLIQNQDNVGFAHACNQGAATGKAEFLAFINPDCFIQQADLEHLLAVLAQSPAIAATGCRVVNADGSFQAASFRRLPTFWRVFAHVLKLDSLPGIRGINLPDPGAEPATRTVPAINGACVLIRREVFEQLNGFDAGYPLHFEDLDLFARLGQSGHQILYQAQVVATHLQGQSSQSSAQVHRWKKQGLWRFMSKHRPSWEAWLIRCLLRLK